MTEPRSTDLPQMTAYRAAPPRLDPPGGAGKGKQPRKRSVAAGRIAAAGVAVSAMLGLTASMQVAGSHAKSASEAATPPPAPAPGLAVLRWEVSTHRGAALWADASAAAARKPIVLTPHTVVHTVGGGSSGGSGGSGGSYAGSYSAPAPAAAPVATTSGSRAP